MIGANDEPEIVVLRLVGDLALAYQRAVASRGLRDLSEPFSVATVEQLHPVARLRAHDMQQIMRLGWHWNHTRVLLTVPSPRTAALFHLDK